MWDRTLPYQPLEKKGDESQQEVKSWKERWEARFGKLDDPDVQAEQKRLETMLKREAIEASADNRRRARQDSQQKDSLQSLYVSRNARWPTGGLRG